MSTFNTKRVWHSALKYKSPLIVQFGTGQIVDSKYDDDAKLIYFTVRGDESEYYYQIENEEIARGLESVSAKEFYSLEADGSHEEGTLTLTPLDAERLSHLPIITTTPVVNKGKGSTSTPESRKMSDPGEFNLGSQEANMEACLVAARDLFLRAFPVALDGTGLSVEDRGIVERLAVSMFIQSNMNRFVLPISIVDSDEDEASEPITTGPDLSDLKELATGLTLQSGMSHDGKQLKRVLTSIADIESMDEEQFEKSMAWVIAEGEHQDGAEGDDLPF